MIGAAVFFVSCCGLRFTLRLWGLPPVKNGRGAFLNYVSDEAFANRSREFIIHVTQKESTQRSGVDD